MSTWRILLNELHDRGPLRSVQFSVDAETAAGALQHPVQLGLVKLTPTGWHLTPKGRMLATGRAILRKGLNGLNRKHVAVATWLVALPYPNEVRL